MGELRKKQKGADSAKVTRGGNFLNASGQHLAIVRELKVFEGRKDGNSKVALEWECKATDNEDNVTVGSKYSWVGNLEKKFGPDEYPDRNRLQQLVEALLGGPESDECTEENVGKIYDVIEEDEHAFDGEEIIIRTNHRPTEDKKGEFTAYEFYAPE